MNERDLVWSRNPKEALRDYPVGTLLLMRWRAGGSSKIDICEISATPSKQAFVSVSKWRFVDPENASFALIGQFQKAVQVEEIPNEPFCYLVESESAIVPGGHDWREHARRVELVAEPVSIGGEVVFNATCTCPSFDKEMHKRISTDHLSRCKHIHRCIPVAYEKLITMWAAHNKEIQCQNKT